MLKLYDYFRSSAAFRVRIALNLKELEFEKIAVDLRENEQFDTTYLTQNPVGLVPTLITPDGHKIHQSLAIIEYLELAYPGTKKLLPENVVDLIYVKELAYDIAMDIHPLNNLRVLNYLTADLHATDAEKNSWYQNWVHKGFSGLEEFLRQNGKYGRFCLGSAPTLADICLVPQVFNARRFKCNLENYPIICSIENNCLQLKAFRDALP